MTDTRDEGRTDAPERIWLQVDPEGEHYDDPLTYSLDGVTWCVDQINDTDVEYVRAPTSDTEKEGQSQPSRGTDDGHERMSEHASENPGKAGGSGPISPTSDTEDVGEEDADIVKSALFAAFESGWFDNQGDLGDGWVERLPYIMDSYEVKALLARLRRTPETRTDSGGTCGATMDGCPCNRPENHAGLHHDGIVYWEDEYSDATQDPNAGDSE